MKKNSKLWLYFVGVIFAIMFVTALLMMTCVFLLFRAGRLNFSEGGPFTPIAFILLISVIIGTAISIIVARTILKPIAAFGNAANEVAKGNFNVSLKEGEGIDEIKALIYHFNRMVQELSRIETLRSDFIINVSHEFKTPIAAIEGYAMLLQDHELSEAERDEYTQMILKSSKQLSALTGNILMLSRLENQDTIPKRERYRLDEQIRQAILMLESEWSVKELDMHIDLEKMTFQGNEELLMQVWINLIGNAVKFTPLGGRVDVRLRQKGQQAIITIADTGCGIDPSVKKYIFDKFYQADTARQSEGNGLGLALVKRIVDLCGGTVAVESEVDAGATFTISLPANG